VDLLIVKRGEKVTVDVPIVLTGEAGRNTLVVSESTTLSIVAEALHLPDSFEVSIEGLEAGSQITAGDVQLPTGSELSADPETVIVVVSAAQTAEQLEGDTGEADEAEVTETEGGEEAAS
jgi:large subunit ribosomal protein L25